MIAKTSARSWKSCANPCQQLNVSAPHRCLPCSRGHHKYYRTDLAILDVNLGYGQPSGLQIYHWLIGQHYPGEIVFLSGHARTDPDVEEASKISGVHFFEKPLGLVEVEGLILGTA